MLKTLEDEEKMKYLNKINNFYNYDDTIIKNVYDKYKIYEKKYGDTLVKISDDTRNKLYQLLEKTVKFLNKKRIDYWLDHGTLLGACRDGKMMDIDDIDLAIPQDSFIKLQEIVKKYKTYPYPYLQNIGDMHINTNIYINKKYDIKFYFYKPCKKEYLIVKDLPIIIRVYPYDDSDDNDDIFIDLLLYIKYENKYVSNITYWINKYKFKIEHMYPLKKIKFGEHKYNCVRNPYDYLNEAYWFWKHLNLASHAHNKKIIKADYRNKKNYFLLS